eukprot:TRINITY_DN2279_c0_g1_i1.p1 TRINITY_DN2279_c0_g1~~TRINITY_DN2279_c0_g1_i1.p1  ORF type:complete len:319 (+),score=52.64 TRINITY_DN2279_c0_g1_i1:322-1278(+)
MEPDQPLRPPSNLITNEEKERQNAAYYETLRSAATSISPSYDPSYIVPEPEPDEDTAASDILYAGLSRLGILLHQAGHVHMFGNTARALAAKADDYLIGNTKLYASEGYLWICVSDKITKVAVFCVIEMENETETSIPKRVGLSFASTIRDLYLYHLLAQHNPNHSRTHDHQNINSALSNSASLSLSVFEHHKLGDVVDRQPKSFQQALERWVCEFDVNDVSSFTLPTSEYIDTRSPTLLHNSTTPRSKFERHIRIETDSDAANDIPSNSLLQSPYEKQRRRRRRIIFTVIALLIAGIALLVVLLYLFVPSLHDIIKI